MEFFMKRNGADAIGFDIIIASGKRSALPHGRASTKGIEKGDFILIDFVQSFRVTIPIRHAHWFVAIPPWNNRNLSYR